MMLRVLCPFPRASLGLAAAFLLSGCGGPRSDGEGAPIDTASTVAQGPIHITWLADVTVPYSSNTGIVLASARTACVIDSYAHRIICPSTGQSDPLILGGQGDGPGEFRSISDIVRGPHGSIGVLDALQSRLTVFDSTGQVVNTVPIPFALQAIGTFDSTLVGRYIPLNGPGRFIEISVGDGRIIREGRLRRPYEFGLAVEGSGSLGHAVRTPGGTFWFESGHRELSLYSSEFEALDIVSAAGYQPELPSSRDIAEYASNLPNIRGTDSVVVAFAREPKPYFLFRRALAIDSNGTLWVATQRGRDSHSYIDIYAGPAYLQSVEVRDRILGFDVLDSVLVVNVERRNRDREGLPVRAIDWYRIRD